jgi:hypothetical protein
MFYSSALATSLATSNSKGGSCQKLFFKQLTQNRDYSAIEETLFIGYPVEFKSFSANGNRNPIWKMKLRNPKNNHEVTALLKPRPWGDGQGWNRTTMEYVGYRVSQMLTMDYIAPVAYRRNLSFGNQFIHEGSVQLFVQNAKSLHNFEKKDWPVDAETFLSDARVLDVLLQNPDRHKDNFMMGTHWLTGETTPLLIDQAASLKPGTKLTLTSPGWGLEQDIKKFKRSTFEGLKNLNNKSLSELSEFLTEFEISKILSRRDGIVAYIENLIQTQGEKSILID